MLNSFREKYVKSPFARNFAVMLSGNGLSLVIPFILAPFLTRLYSPEDFAGYELFVRFLLPLAAISCLRYELAIILPRKAEDATGLMKLCFRILFVVTFLSAIVFIPFRNFWSELSNNDSLSGLLWWLPVGVFFSGMLMILNNFMLRETMFRSLSVNKVWAVSSNHMSKYLFGLKWTNPLGLVSGHIFGAVAPVATLMTSRRIRTQLKKIRDNTSNLRELSRRYREFPLFNASHAFYDEANRAVLFLIISVYYGEITLGLFAITMRYVRIPVQVFGASLNQVFLPQLARDYNDRIDIRRRIKKIMLGNAVVGILPFSLLFFFGEEMFAFIFGAEWSMAGVYAQLIAPWLFFNFITSPVSMVPTIVTRQKTYFFLTVVATMSALILTGLLSNLDYSFTTVVIGISAIMASMDVFLIFWFVNIAGQKSSSET